MPAPSAASSRSQLVGQMQKIVDNMMMEAAEKCEEIDVKCEEEYQVLRRKEISEQGEIIEKAEKKKKEAVQRDDRVFYTKLVNNSRLAQLKAKNDIYYGIIDEVKRRIAKDNSSRYQQLLKNSLTQALYMLMEPDVNIICRRKDQNIISSCFEPAASAYEKNTKLHIKLCFSKHTLPDNSQSGGMLVCNEKQNVSVNCLLDSRVDEVCHLAMPMIVEMLFSGVQPLLKDSPKISLQKAITPEDPACRLSQEKAGPRKSGQPNQSVSPEPQGLLEERLGIGTSSINILAPKGGESEMPQSPEKEHEDVRQSTSHSPSPDLQDKEVRRNTSETPQATTDRSRSSRSPSSPKPNQGGSSGKGSK